VRGELNASVMTRDGVRVVEGAGWMLGRAQDPRRTNGRSRLRVDCLRRVTLGQAVDGMALNSSEGGQTSIENAGPSELDLMGPMASCRWNLRAVDDAQPRAIGLASQDLHPDARVVRGAGGGQR